ncbi:hypothetical protein HD599_002143 [Conyzicola lurida]|uniref:Ricin B lectin domain-containing protein n=1 Tax=Conyzicola lurida TaxID=1172621 RepID=A0A841AIV7_9MICO|nr:RICIN domain-containing protein [Conyzicola lurida]MBB5843820.1 hypothetical protein [Conyzicola lurida]
MTRERGLSRIPGLRASAVIAAVVLVVGIGSTASFAAWTGTTAKSASVTAASTALTSSGISGLAATYKPGLPGVTASALTDTVLVTVANTGTTPLAYGITSSGGDATLNGQITLQVWKAAGTTCAAATAVAANATSGTLAAPPAMPSDAASAAAGATLTLCMRTTSAGTYTTTGTTSPTVTVTGTVGTSWTASAAASFTQVTAFNWYQVVHALSDKCMDSNGGGVATGTTLILYPCKALSTTSNQSFRFAQVGATAYYRIYIGAGTTSGPVVAANNNVIGTAVSLQPVTLGDVAASNNQQWMVVAHGTAGDFRLVLKNPSNLGATLCLNMPSSTDVTGFTVTACGTNATPGTTVYNSQHFNFTEVP